MSRWLVLSATLPTSPSGLRVKVWRALKATGAGVLREGVHLLPEDAPTAHSLRALERTIADAGADAHLLSVSARDEAQEQAFRALFDRGELYADLLQSIKALHAGIRGGSESRLRRELHALDRQLHSLQAIDFFPGQAQRRARDALAAVHREITHHFSPDEPAPTGTAIEPLAIADYQGQTWATRRRPWIDRLATAWLIQRFVDREPRFVWLDEAKRCPRNALGFDFDGATFTHVADKVTFEVVAESFGLLDQPAMPRLAALVHYCDVGGIPVDEAPGLEMVIRGLQACHLDDDALLQAAIGTFDAVYAAMQGHHDR